jgi:hypothetical protein
MIASTLVFDITLHSVSPWSEDDNECILSFAMQITMTLSFAPSRVGESKSISCSTFGWMRQRFGFRCFKPLLRSLRVMNTCTIDEYYESFERIAGTRSRNIGKRTWHNWIMKDCYIIYHIFWNVNETRYFVDRRKDEHQSFFSVNFRFHCCRKFISGSCFHWIMRIIWKESKCMLNGSSFETCLLRFLECLWNKCRIRYLFALLVR